MIHKKIFFLLFLFSILAFQAAATHLRGGEITVAREDCGSLTATITITVYLDAESTVPFGGGWLDFGDGTDPIQIPEQTSTPTDLGNNVSKATFTITHTYASPGKYLITYTEPNRNAGILNVPNSVQTRFHLETLIAIDPSVGCNNSPVLLIPPIDKGCGCVPFYHNAGAFDPDGDSLSYELVVPKSDPGVTIQGYVFPDDPSLYPTPCVDADPPVFNIDPITGLITWNAPPDIDANREGAEYNFSFIVREWRKLFGKWIPLGFVRRDMQVIIEECDNEIPELEIPEDICVEAGTLIEEEIFGYDPDKDSVKIEVFSQILTFDANAATYEPANNPFQLISDEVQGRVNFRWQTDCEHVQNQSYQVVFKITDKGAPKLVNFETWNIRVIGPSPVIQPVVNEVVDERLGLRVSWDPYLCDNADLMEVWRKVDSNPYEPDSCETGIRPSAGYNKIAELPINSTSYLDQDLSMGAKYCYRLVAIFEDNIEAESVVSDEQCYEFVEADAPVITHVSIQRTDPEQGEVRVSWKKPFDLDPAEFPGDYYYDLYRATGFSGNSNIQFVERIINDTTFLDQNLNTEDQVYNYRIVLRVPESQAGEAPVDTSAVASTVRIEPTPDFNQVELTWQADVPWSNVIATGEGAYHYIFRGNEGAKTISELNLIDSVKVAETGFNYIDSNDLDNDQVYCYAVLTRGTYGNPQIQSPLDNLSQIICVQPIDTIAPCTPVFELEGIDCDTYGETYGCDFNNFQNQLFWSPDPSFVCQDDIRLYEIYYAPTTVDEFVKIAETRDTSYIHTPDNEVAPLSSFKGCYKIRALDRSGNFSEFSNVFCFDNCPNYELPNVFTPGKQDGCNDLFSAFRDKGQEDETGGITFPCGPVDPARCARFVKSVDFMVVNRWGKEVFSYESGGENTIYINWDGTDNNGEPLPAGVYYYVAKVTFDVVNPDEAEQDIKGWVHILR